jgi:hypothetical protein
MAAHSRQSGFSQWRQPEQTVLVEHNHAKGHEPAHHRLIHHTGGVQALSDEAEYDLLAWL